MNKFNMLNRTYDMTPLPVLLQVYSVHSGSQFNRNLLCLIFFKIDDRSRQTYAKKAAKTPTSTLKELQEYLANHYWSISRIFQYPTLWGTVARCTVRCLKK